jgi:uncharacterized protein YdeI (YjbR/CyaY-like superfamily)
MGSKDKRIDAYIIKAQPFAQPVLRHLRELVHKGCPDVEETIKWGMPSFEYKGPFCSMASFKQHCVFGFWKSKLLNDAENYLGKIKSEGGEAMGNLGRLTSLRDLPSDKIMLDFIKQAKKLNDEGIKLPSQAAKEKKELTIPDYFIKALKKHRVAFEAFENFSYSHQKEYVEWITEAKTEDTREKRMNTAIEWISEGKGRNWKYGKKK